MVLMHALASAAYPLATVSLPAYPSVTGAAQPIAAKSLSWFLWAVAWGGLLLVCFNGWGRFAGKLIRVERLPASVACSLGVAVIILLGGVVNLFNAIYTSVIFLAIAAGVSLYLVLRKHRPDEYRWGELWKSTTRLVRTLLIVTLVIVALRACATVRLGSFDVTDDGSSYLAFPRVMLAYHHFAPGPFSDRHVISSVGGGYWLQVFVIAATSLANIGMADRTLGLLLIFAAVFDLCIAFGLSVEQIAVLEFLVALVAQPTANLTFVILPIALLLSLLWLVFRSIQEGSTLPWRYAFLAGAIGGATVALKSTFLPCVALFCLTPYLVARWRGKREALLLSMIAGAGAIAVLAAWMVAMKLTAGTWLFPILGHGLDHTNSGIFGSFTVGKTPRTVIKLFLQGFVLLALGFGAFRLQFRDRRAYFCLSVMIGAALGITAFNIAAGGDSIWRYGFPQFLVAILIYSIGLIALSAQATSLRKRHVAWGLAILPLIGCWFYFDIAGARPHAFRQMTSNFSHYGPSLTASLSGRSLSSPALASEYRAVEGALSGSGITLENVAYPFLLNYKARKIYLMDWPGAAGPAPGWPFGANASMVAQYLRRNSVRYLLYDTHYARWADARSCQVLENPRQYSSELYVLFWMSLLAHHQLDAVRARYRSVYDDGKIVAIDLNRPIKNAPVSRPMWTVSTDTEAMCSVVMAQNLADPVQAESR